MRWLPVRKADINAGLRKTFEQHGVATMQAILASTNFFQHEGKDVLATDVRKDLLPWLTEQNDRAELRETWSLTMEFMVTLFVGIEVLPKVFHYLKYLKGLICW
ncbi:MAG: hypothetical protein ACRD5M_15250 [Candidatus Acidiferrales bacterium]